MVYQGALENINVITYLTVLFFGILVSFTPCVYPIIPVIIGYLGAAEIKTKKEVFFRALIYILGMASVYSMLGALAAFTGKIFGSIQSNFWVNLIAGNVFILMGLFMLDVFQLPQFSFFNKNIALEKSGWWGAFLLGVISGMVSGPCTTPVLGAILAYVAAKQNIVVGITLLFTYALGMGIPLLILGTFVGLVKKMPKSGYWMVRIKKIFGLLLIASGEYFLLRIR
ncbi:MAG: sulfite exporter TauE/SafE family protein [Candidatus Omnitrophica bacterium]|nr:sulfite exporter TauE/SafE family protein [Candidatus Omnitrophota bacterium]